MTNTSKRLNVLMASYYSYLTGEEEHKTLNMLRADFQPGDCTW